MAIPFQVKIIEQCNISPPPDSIITPISLPLTFLDIPWLLHPSNQTLFFFPKPLKSATTTTLISLLKQSLSATLHHFHPLAGNLSSPPPPTHPHITYTKGDSVSLTIAESNTTINNLSGNHPRHVTNLHSLLPSMSRDSHVTPLLAIQLTFFNDSAYSIGLTTQHVAADERTLDHFIKSWASICKSLLNKDSCILFKSTPLFDRSVISDPNSLKTTFLKQWWKRLDSPKDSIEKVDENLVHATFVLSSSDMNMIKNHILEKCKMINEDPPLHLSPYVSACSFVWICILKAKEAAYNSQSTLTSSTSCPLYLGFNAGGITRLGYEVPSSYFGNCIAFGRCKAFRSELMGENGVVFAAKAIGKEIKRLDGDVLGGAERWICEWDELNIRVLGSPKVDSYGVDFGWGKVCKVEKLSSEQNGGVHVISLTGSRDFEGGIEVGVVLSKARMSAFTELLNGGLMDLA